MSKRSFEKAVTFYLKEPTKKGGKTKSRAFATPLNFMIKRWQHKDIEQITNFDVTELIHDLRDGNSPSGRELTQHGINSYLAALKAVMRYAKKNLDMKFEMPDFEGRIPKVEGRSVFLTPEQARDFLRALDPLRRDLFKFALMVGARKENCRTLTWSHLDDTFENVQWKSSETKNKQPLRVPLNADARELIQFRWDQKIKLERSNRKLIGQIENVFFQQNGQPFAPDSITNKTFHRARRAAGIPDGVVFHTSRHCFASWHIEAGTSLPELKDLGGWSDLKSIEHYLHFATEHQKRASSRLEGLTNA
jgi:integrase